MSYIILILIIVALAVVVVLLQKKIQDLEKKLKGRLGSDAAAPTEMSGQVGVPSAGGLDEYNRKMQEKKDEYKNKILELLKEKGKIQNDDVQKLLGVSDASATNYLSELEKEGKIRQIGVIGHAVYYELVNG